jgi:hypothetical protein
MYAPLSKQIKIFDRNALCREETYLDVIVIVISSIIHFETHYTN